MKSTNKFKFTPVIGIEVHVELATKSKMFCGCSANHFSTKPNTLTCPVCLGLPGALPVPNRQAVDWTIFLGLALGSRINHHSKFDRKHYFYPDLPKGYQISQYDQPLGVGGSLDTPQGKVSITRVHLEEDTGKLVHTKIPSSAEGLQHKTLKSQKVSLIDFNRSGVPLVEIVSEPDITSSDQAKAYAKNLARIIRFLGISDADMEKGSMRLEANVSLGMDLGYKVELKNINSFNFLARAIDYELDRQQKLLDQGTTPAQETRGYNEQTGKTFSQRSKEEAQDYRYFPEPDIPPMQFTDQDIDKIKSQLPQLPAAIQTRWHQDYHLKDQYYDVLLANPIIASYTDETLALAASSNLDSNLVTGAIVNKKVDITKVKPQQLIHQLQQDQTKVTDTDQIGDWVKQALADNPQAVTDYQAGKATALQFLLGQVMRLSRGQADPQLIRSTLLHQLKA